VYVNALAVAKGDQYLVAAGRKDIRIFDLSLKEPIHHYENAHEGKV